MVKHRLSLLVAATLVGCGAGPSAPADAGLDAAAHDAAQDAGAVHLDAGSDAGSDAGIDAGADAGSDAGADGGADAGLDAATCPRTLLVGGTDVAAQGWNTLMQSPATLTYGADYVQLETTTTSGSTVGGQLLLTRPDALVPGMPFRLEVEMLVQSVDPHNAFDSAAAILGSFTPPFGVGADRAAMIYLDPAALGWSDDSQSFAATITDGAYHTYELAVDGSSVARVSIDGMPALMRTGFTTNGTIALGDQTNDANVDSTLRIRSVTLLCP